MPAGHTVHEEVTPVPSREYEPDGHALQLPADCADAGPGGAYPPRATLRNVLILDYSYE